MPAVPVDVVLLLLYNLLQMRILRSILMLLLLVTANNVLAQHAPDKKAKPAKVNQKDNKGHKQGPWVYTVPEKRGEDGYTEFGNYLDDMRAGLWYKMNTAGDLVSIENYKKDVLDGESKYYTKGKVTCIGQYRGLNPDVKIDTVMVIEPVTGEQILVGVEADRGTLRHGVWKYYDELSGDLRKVEEYQIDSLIYEKFYPLSKSDSAFYEERNKNLPHMRSKQEQSKNSRKQNAHLKHSYLN